MAFSCSQSREHCQSRFFKEWHPDYIAAYNSLGDPHLRHYFAHPARKNHLSRNHQVSNSIRYPQLYSIQDTFFISNIYHTTKCGSIYLDPRRWINCKWTWMEETEPGMGEKKTGSWCKWRQITSTCGGWEKR